MYLINNLWLGLWCLTSLQQYFSYIMVVSFIGGGNQSTQIENHRPDAGVGFELTALVIIIVY